MKKIKALSMVKLLMPIVSVFLLVNLYGELCWGRNPATAVHDRPKTFRKWKPTYVKVEFFRVQNRTKSLGTAEWKDGKVIVHVSDRTLKKILESPFATLSGKSTLGKNKNGKCTLIRVELKPGTLEHLTAVAQQAQGYIGIISEESAGKKLD